MQTCSSTYCKNHPGSMRTRCSHKEWLMLLVALGAWGAGRMSVDPGAAASGVGGTASVQRTHPKEMLRQASKPCPKESGKGTPLGAGAGQTQAGRRGCVGREQRLVPKVYGRPCQDRASPGPPRCGPCSSPEPRPGGQHTHRCPADSCFQSARAWASGGRPPSTPEAGAPGLHSDPHVPQHSQEHTVSVSKAWGEAVSWEARGPQWRQ